MKKKTGRKSRWTVPLNRKQKKSHDSAQYDTAGRLTLHSMIARKNGITLRNPNQNRKYFNPLVNGQWPRQVQMMKKGGQKSRWTVP